jgi:hypothetical protein
MGPRISISFAVALGFGWGCSTAQSPALAAKVPGFAPSPSPSTAAPAVPVEPPPPAVVDDHHVVAADYVNCVTAGQCPPAPSRETPLRVGQVAAQQYCQSVGKRLPSAVEPSLDDRPEPQAEGGHQEWSLYRGPLWIEGWKKNSGIKEWERDYSEQVHRARDEPAVAYSLACDNSREPGVPCLVHRIDEPRNVLLPFRCATGDARNQARMRLQSITENPRAGTHRRRLEAAGALLLGELAADGEW